MDESGAGEVLVSLLSNTTTDFTGKHFTLVGARNDDYGVTFGGAVAIDSATYVMWGVLLVLALPSVLLMADRVSEPDRAALWAQRHGLADGAPNTS